MERKLSTDTIFTLLADSQRRHLLDLMEANESRTVDELAEQLAVQEQDMQEVSEDVHQRIVISLVHKHLPLLADHNVVSYDRDSKEVALADGVNELKTDLGDGNSSDNVPLQQSGSDC